jgi:hypothetical protein
VQHCATTVQHYAYCDSACGWHLCYTCITTAVLPLVTRHPIPIGHASLVPIDQSRALAHTVFVSSCNVPVPSLHTSNPPFSSTLMPRGCDRDSCASNSAGRRESMQRPRTVEHLHPRGVAHKHLAVRVQDAHGGSISRSNTVGARAERQRHWFCHCSCRR